MTDAIIRDARAADLPACAAIINNYIDATGWLPRRQTHGQITALFSPALLSARRMTVAEQAGQIVGYASFDADAAFLPALYLLPDARGQGIGKALLDAVKSAAQNGFGLTVWTPNAAARRFYEREEFVVTSEGQDEEALPLWHMRWDGRS